MLLFTGAFSKQKIYDVSARTQTDQVAGGKIRTGSEQIGGQDGQHLHGSTFGGIGFPDIGRNNAGTDADAVSSAEGNIPGQRKSASTDHSLRKSTGCLPEVPQSLPERCCSIRFAGNKDLHLQSVAASDPGTDGIVHFRQVGSGKAFSKLHERGWKKRRCVGITGQADKIFRVRICGDIGHDGAVGQIVMSLDDERTQCHAERNGDISMLRREQRSIPVFQGIPGNEVRAFHPFIFGIQLIAGRLIEIGKSKLIV